MKFDRYKADGNVVRSVEKVIIYKSELDYLSKCILESPTIETGGNLFGLWTPFGIPMIHYVVGPGPDAIHNVTHFRQDFHFLDTHADYLVAEHALHHVGSWHSHHTLGLTEPSQGDTSSTLEGMHECGLDSFLLIIGNCRNGKSSVQPYRYHSNGTCELLRWVVLDGISPIREAFDHQHADLVYSPSGLANMIPLDTCDLIEQRAVQQTAVTYSDGYWLNDPENKKQFVEMIKILKPQFDHVKIFQKDDKTIEIQVGNGLNILSIHLHHEFPQKPPKVFRVTGAIANLHKSDEWNPNNIIESFTHFINSIQYDI